METHFEKILGNRFTPFILVILNLLLLIKLRFFIPLLSGELSLFDFDTYYHLVNDIKSGINPYSVGYMQSLGPPLVFIYFIFYSFFSLAKARVMSTLISILAGILICWILAKKYFPKNKINYFLIFNLIFFSAFPVRFSIEMGQSNLISALLITLILVGNGANKKSLFLGLLISIKTFFIFSLISFLRKTPKAILMVLIFLGFFIIFSFLFIKPAWYGYYFNMKLPGILSISSGEPISNLDYYNQSLRSTLGRFSVPSMYPFFEIIGFILLSLLTLVTGNFSLSIPSILILSPVSWQHYYTVLFPIIIITFLTSKSILTKTLIIVSGLLWWIEIPLLHNSPVNFINSLLASHYFFSAVILLFVIIFNHRSLK